MKNSKRDMWNNAATEKEPNFITKVLSLKKMWGGVDVDGLLEQIYPLHN